MRSVLTATSLSLLLVGLSGCGPSAHPPPPCGPAPCSEDPSFPPSINGPGGPWKGKVPSATEATSAVARFRFYADSWRNYLVVCTPETLMGCSVSVRDAFTGEVIIASASNVAEQVSVIPWSPEGGVWLIEFSAFDASSSGSFSYEVRDLGLDDYPLAPELLLERTPSTESFPMRVDAPGDTDTFFLEAQAGHTYHMGCKPWSGSGDVWNVVVREQGGQLLVKHPFNSWLQPAMELTVDRTRRLLFSLETSTAAFVSGFDCTLVDEGPDEHADTPRHATALTPANPVAGGLQRDGDVDVFSAPVQQGHYYRFSCIRKTLSHCQVVIRDASGAARYQFSAQQSLEFRVGNSETYSFTLTGSDFYSYPILGTYTVLFEDLGTDDHGDTLASATPLTPSAEPVHGAIQSYIEQDVFTFTPTARHIYRFGCDLDPAGPRWRLVIVDARGDVVTQSPLQRDEVRVEAPASGGPLFIRLSPSLFQQGPYTCHLEDLGLDDHGGTLAEATVIEPAPSVTVNGNKDTFSDADVFAFTATAGQRYHLTCDVGARNTCATYVYNASGSLQGSTFTDDWIFTPPSNGTYYIEVSSSLPWGPYVLQLTRETP